MAVALKLAELANDAGFRRRLVYALRKQAFAVVASASPAAADLTLAKRLLTADDGESMAERLVWVFLADATVAEALDGASYAHASFADSAIDTRVAALFATMAKAL